MQETALHSSSARIAFVDVVRGLALVAMTIYHFTWDLEFFGWILPATTLETGWVAFARAIAASFLYLVGVSLVLAHGDGIRWRGFLKRLVQIAVAAACISLATYAAFQAGELTSAYGEQLKVISKLNGEGGLGIIDYLVSPLLMDWPTPGTGFIFFGILHAIALFSVAGLLFVRLHWSISAVAAVLIMAIWFNFTNETFSGPALWWVGLAPSAPPSNDYVPMFPWMAAVLAGISFSKIATKLGLWRPFADLSLPGIFQRPLIFIGRHSLVYYLLHQPVMLAAIWTFTTVAGPPDKTGSFIRICTIQCSQSKDEAFCKPYCACTAEGLKREKLFDRFHEGKLNLNTNLPAQSIIRACSKAQK